MSFIKIQVGQLAMETLLSLTSKRAGEWFKEELRELGGLEHIMKTICECCRQVSDYVVTWTDTLLDKLRKVDRCMRVLENVSCIFMFTHKKSYNFIGLVVLNILFFVSLLFFSGANIFTVSTFIIISIIFFLVTFAFLSQNL